MKQAFILQPKTINLKNEEGQSTFQESEIEFYSLDNKYVLYCDIDIVQLYDLIQATHNSPAEVECGDKVIEITNIHVMEYESGEFISVDIEKQKEEILKALIII